MKCIEILEIEMFTVQVCSHPDRGPLIILRHAGPLDFLQGSRRLENVTSRDYFCTLTSHTEQADHNVTALRGIGIRRAK